MKGSIRQLVLILTICSTGAAWANSVRGQVRYADGQPADHVMVRLRCDHIVYDSEVQTDILGRFEFDALTPDVYHLTIEGQGFFPYSHTIDVSMSHMANELITLRPIKAPETKEVSPVKTGDETVPAEARKEFEAGQKLMNDGKDLDGSLQHFRKAIQLYNNYPEAYLMVGLVSLDQRKLDDAQAALQKSTELAPHLAQGFLALGAVYNQEKKFDDAQKALTRGLELKPDDAQGESDLARTYLAMGKWQDAEPHAQKSVSLNPELPIPHIFLGNIALKKQDNQTAVKEFKEYLRLDPRGPMAGAVQQMVAKIEAAGPPSGDQKK